MSEQLVMEKLVNRNWGGARKGAGRKPRGTRSSTAHVTREGHSRHHPMHITMRAESGLPSMRCEEVYEILREVLVLQSSRPYAKDFQVVEHTVQDDHMHLVAESTTLALPTGTSGFKIAFARRFNALLGRTGKVWGDRYNVHELRTPTEVRNALRYVFSNSVKHGIRSIGGAPDLYSSIFRFGGLTEPLDYSIPVGPWARPWPKNTPRTWLLRTGWKKRGLLSLASITTRSAAVR